MSAECQKLRPLGVGSLRELRRERGLTLRQVAERSGSGLTAQALSKLERRDPQASQLFTLAAVARGLDLVLMVDRHGQAWFCLAEVKYEQETNNKYSRGVPMTNEPLDFV